MVGLRAVSINENAYPEQSAMMLSDNSMTNAIMAISFNANMCGNQRKQQKDWLVVMQMCGNQRKQQDDC